MDKKQRVKKMELTRKFYSSREGRMILADQLNDLFLFRTDLRPEEVHIENKAKELLEKMGIWRPGNMLRIVDALMDMPYRLPDDNYENESKGRDQE